MMVFALHRILFPIFLIIFAALIGKHNIPLPNPLKLLITPARSVCVGSWDRPGHSGVREWAVSVYRDVTHNLSI